MVEMTIGSRFYYKDKLCEVVEEDCSGMNGVLNGDVRKCNKAKCHASERHDKKFVCFKEVKDENI